MRTVLLSAFLLPATVHAQSDYLANDPVWTVTQVCNQSGFGGGPCITTDVLNYKLAGESIIEGLTYTKVERTGTVDPMWTGVEPTPPSCINTYTYGPWHAGLIRQEGRTLRMWDGDSDELLFDFELLVGGYLPLTANNSNPAILVTAVDSVEMNGEWRRIYTVQGDWTEQIIEGVGSDKGLFEPVSTGFECGYILDCFSIGGQGYYPEPGPDCDMHIGLAETKRERLIVVPNPTSGSLQLTLPGELQDRSVQVLDAHGRLCWATTLLGSRTTLDLSTLPNGTYLLRIGSYRERVVVVR